MGARKQGPKSVCTRIQKRVGGPKVGGPEKEGDGGPTFCAFFPLSRSKFRCVFPSLGRSPRGTVAAVHGRARLGFCGHFVRALAAYRPAGSHNPREPKRALWVGHGLEPRPHSTRRLQGERKRAKLGAGQGRCGPGEGRSRNQTHPQDSTPTHSPWKQHSPRTL